MELGCIPDKQRVCQMIRYKAVKPIISMGMAKARLMIASVESF